MRRRRAIHAHTLVEVLVALALAALVLTATVSLYRTQRRAYGTAVDIARTRDAASTALALIAQAVRMAGFAPLDRPTPNVFTPLFGCTSARPAGDAMQPVCISAAAGSDGLLVRYVGDAVSTWPTASGLVTDCLGQGIDASGKQPLVVNRYFVRASGATGEPELYCDGSGRSGTAQPLVEGVERLRLRYRLHGRAVWDDAAAIARDAWRDVIAVDVCVQVRGAAGAPAVRYVDCDGVVRVARDGRRRWIARRWLALRNARVSTRAMS